MPRQSHNLAVHGGKLALWLFADRCGKRLMKCLQPELRVLHVDRVGPPRKKLARYDNRAAVRRRAKPGS